MDAPYLSAYSESALIPPILAIVGVRPYLITSLKLSKGNMLPSISILLLIPFIRRYIPSSTVATPKNLTLRFSRVFAVFSMPWP
ncbi:MAG: hypothetical protein BWY26_00727 [Elusimicrobia bacterium ADurb.Bin231]|nr:MAG: hypothetical protein BWY26_00727 [Elusimicrobia bacterium ADurb.Bin231]